MVADEAAACGVLPVSAGHSGAAEVSAMLAAAVPAPARGWLTFPIDDGAVRAIAERVNVGPRGAGRAARCDTGRAGGHGACALLVGGRGPRGDRRGAGRPGGAAARGLI